MSQQKIFLSYRRDDIPGYVARLEDELARAFGSERVFRDVEDIVGGSEWKNVIDQNLADAGALILIIGPRWSEIWTSRENEPVNYVALELQRARDLGVKIIPVTIENASISRDTNLGEISWLREKQVHNISDRQGRWHRDVQGLIKILGRIPGIGSPEQQIGTRKKPLLAVLGLAIVAIIGLGIWLATPAPEPTLEQASEEASEQASELTQKQGPISSKHPNISGKWVSQKKGLSYEIKQRSDGRFKITRADGASGAGHFLDKMPGKASYELDGIGRGQLTLFNSKVKIHIWIVKQGTSEQLHDTLLKK